MVWFVAMQILHHKFPKDQRVKEEDFWRYLKPNEALWRYICGLGVGRVTFITRLQDFEWEKDKKKRKKHQLTLIHGSKIPGGIYNTNTSTGSSKISKNSAINKEPVTKFYQKITAGGDVFLPFWCSSKTLKIFRTGRMAASLQTKRMSDPE